MGTHPIFESDFDCLTDVMSNPPTSDFSKLKLNPGAISFVPGKNFNAPAFVPGGFSAPPPKQGEPPKKEPEPESVVEEKKPESVPEPTPEPKEEVVLDFVNVVFIGHVDAGKSTMSGQILKVTGMVDARTLEKYERESKEKNRESWALSWCIDTNDEERDKGKTVEYGKAFFETEKKHFTILDAPGHKSFVPSMIEGASQADFAILIISARKGEFETGFEMGGQTREHAMLVKTQGIKRLVVAINKMDDPTVEVKIPIFFSIFS